MRLLLVIAIVAATSIALALIVLDLTEMPESFEEAIFWLQSFEAWLWGAAMLVIVGDAFLILPSDAAILTLGVVYGTMLGGLLAASASVAGGMLVFWAAGALGERRATRIIGERDMRRLHTFIERWGFYAVVLARAVGGPLEIVPALAGLTNMRTRTVFAAICIGGIPAAFLKAGLGDLAKHQPIVVLFVAVFVSFLVSALAHRPINEDQIGGMSMDKVAKKQLLWSIVFVPVVFFVSPWGAMSISDFAGLPEWDSVAGNLIGGALVLGAIVLYSYCRILFSKVGHGTTGPIDQTEYLVKAGPFRYVRNPIYLAYVAYFLGLYLIFGHALLLGLAILTFGFIHAVLVLWEEPELVERFGDDFEKYTRQTPRWFPKVPIRG